MRQTLARAPRATEMSLSAKNVSLASVLPAGWISACRAIRCSIPKSPAGDFDTLMRGLPGRARERRGDRVPQLQPYAERKSGHRLEGLAVDRGVADAAVPDLLPSGPELGLDARHDACLLYTTE